MPHRRSLLTAARGLSKQGSSPAWLLSLLLARPCRRCFSEGSRRQQSQPPASPSPPPSQSKEPPKSATTVPNGATVFSGIQPTGVPHLGNYLGALLRWVQLQDEAEAAAGAADPKGPKKKTQLLYSVVDLHALTSVQPEAGGDVLRQRRRDTLAMFLAIGLDPDRCVLFYQSAVPAHAELMWLLSCTASVGYLSRMTQWKSKLLLPDDAPLFSPGDPGGGKGGTTTTSAAARLKLGLFSYPVLQAADVLVHRATHVPVGDDQRQHLEFARECAGGFNHVHGDQGRRPVLVPPQTLLSPARRVMSLQDPAQKMSKSTSDARARVLLTDEPATIRATIRAARTDGTNAVSYDPGARPGVANLLELLALTEGEGVGAAESVEEKAAALAAAPELAGRPLAVLKDRVADAVVWRLRGIRERFLDVRDRDGGAYLDRVAAHGAARARANAAETMDAVREAVGL